MQSRLHDRNGKLLATGTVDVRDGMPAIQLVEGHATCLSFETVERMYVFLISLRRDDP